MIDTREEVLHFKSADYLDAKVCYSFQTKG